MRIGISRRPRFAALVAMGAVISMGVGIFVTRAQSPVVTFTIKAVSGTTLTIGSVYVASIKNTNNSGSSLTVTDNFYLISPSAMRVHLVPTAKSANMSVGGSWSTMQQVTTTTFSTETGVFTYEVDAVDSGGNVVGTATSTFTILALPAGLLAPRFTDVATAAGVAAIHHDDPSDCMNMMGTGAGWADYDGDGRPDLFVSDYNGPSHLYHNDGGLSFTEVTSSAFPNLDMNLPHAAGVTWADYDNDGHPDLLVMTLGHPYLFHNNGDGTFSDVTTAAGLAGFTGRGESSAWGDFDADGYVDLYLGFYNQNCNATPLKNTALAPDRLLHNNGDGTFTDVTSYLGGTANSAVTGMTFAASWVDYNNDGRLDLYVVHDFGGTIKPNVLWRNDGSDGVGGWTFTDVSSSSKANLAASVMGVGVGDYDRNGFFDFICSNIGRNFLLKNLGNGTFREIAQTAGTRRAAVLVAGEGEASVTWGVGTADLNNDGYEDIYMAAGNMMMQMDDQPNVLLLNNLNNHLTGRSNDGVFLDLSYATGADTSATSRTIAFADADGDGWMDIFVSNLYSEAPQLYRNVSSSDGNVNNWLEVRLVGAGAAPLGSLPHGSNRDGIGTRITAAAGSDTQYRQIISGSSLGAGNQVLAHFGLGSHTTVDTLTILWPSGLSQTFTNVGANQRLVATEGSDTLGTE